ncbi:MAG: PVC-type heme-binding CxxCH protein [Pirellulales bacterium]
MSFLVARANSCVGFAIVVALTAAIAAAERPNPAAVRQAEQAIGRFKVPDGLKVELFAAEPLLANPVAFCFDERGRVYVAETHRVLNDRGVEDNRNHMHWLDDDLAAQTVEDRVAYIKKHRAAQLSEYTKYSEIVKRIEDTDGDGRADRATVFADGFNNIADGAAAGVLARNGDVYFTCIPHLWKLRDNNGDGRADERTSLHYGYGVKFAFFGHDLHGLTIGPDGRLYFSIGDRGFNVTSQEGKKLVNTDSGGVLRCELDGSDLEVFCIGLRNPQELVFDDYGNLFTCDNNSDSGDRARWTHLVEGADYGWRMHYQYLPDRGPWNREKLWHPHHTGQAAYIIPCITNITDGPSGITYYPGTGLGEEYRGHFFVCDFRGTPATSCVYTWTVKPKGASFELTGARKFLEGMLATDCDFGPDGGLYVSDWIDGWTGLGKGRIYRVMNPAATRDPRVHEVKELLTTGFAKRSTEELAKLLGHADRRVRLEAQFELVARREYNSLLDVAVKAEDGFARLHGVWGAGHLLRLEKRSSDRGEKQNQLAFARLVALLGDENDEIAGQAAMAIADAGPVDVEARSPLKRTLSALFDRDNPRAKLQAATASATIGTIDVPELLQGFQQAYATDPVLRHALLRAINSVTKVNDTRVWISDVSNPSPETRLAYVLAERLKRRGAPLLDDSDPRVVLEAARTIHDLPAENLLPPLAALLDKPYAGSAEQYDALFRRVLNANFRLGKAEHAMALAEYAGRGDVPEHLRIEALEMLGQWAEPNPRDRVLGSWRPLAEREGSIAAGAIRAQLGPVFSGPAKIRQKAAEVAGRLGIKEVVPELVKLLSDETIEASARAAALAAIARLDAATVDRVLKSTLADKDPIVRIEARRVLAQRDPAAAVENLKQPLANGTMPEKQAAYATLGAVANSQADQLLAAALTDLLAGKLRAEVRLDLVTAARDRIANADDPSAANAALTVLQEKLQTYDASLPKDDPLAPYRIAIAGGAADRGRAVFFDKVALSCLRCHKINDDGGEVGPDLSKIGADKTREYLLESIVEPNKTIAKGFETVVITLDDGRAVSGIVKSQTAEELTLITAEAKTVTIPTAEILERTTGQSSMPADLVKQMSLRELRDLVEFLSGLR